jgi:hypothetical protein
MSMLFLLLGGWLAPDDFSVLPLDEPITLRTKPSMLLTTTRRRPKDSIPFFREGGSLTAITKG